MCLLGELQFSSDGSRGGASVSSDLLSWLPFSYSNFVQGLLIVHRWVIVLCDTFLWYCSVLLFLLTTPYAGIDYSCIPYLNRIDHPCFG